MRRRAPTEFDDGTASSDETGHQGIIVISRQHGGDGSLHASIKQVFRRDDCISAVVALASKRQDLRICSVIAQIGQDPISDRLTDAVHEPFERNLSGGKPAFLDRQHFCCGDDFLRGGQGVFVQGRQASSRASSTTEATAKSRE